MPEERCLVLTWPPQPDALRLLSLALARADIDNDPLRRAMMSDHDVILEASRAAVNHEPYAATLLFALKDLADRDD